MAIAAIAPATTAPTATPIPAIEGVASPPEGEAATGVVVSRVNGAVVEVPVVVHRVLVNQVGMLPVENHASRYSRLNVVLYDVESQ